MSFLYEDNSVANKNRETFVGHKNFVSMQCNHGTDIKLVSTNREKVVETEVLVTNEKNLTLLLLTADCLPTAFYDPISKTIALAHMSRETIAAGLPNKTVTFLQNKLGVKPENLLVFVGPHIKGRSYKFSLPLKEVKPLIKPFVNKTNKEAYIDIEAAHNDQLIKSGVDKDNIYVSPIDTFTSRDHFSHFRYKTEQKEAGRIATILAMN